MPTAALALADFAKFLVDNRAAEESAVRALLAEFHATRPELGPPMPLDGQARIDAAFDAELASKR